MKPKLILIVEDDQAVRQGLAQALRLEGWQVVEAADGTTGFELFHTYPTSIVVTDLMMLPGPNGLQMMAKIRDLDPQVPFVVLTAHATPETRDTAMRAGADAVLQKPVEVKELLRVIDRALKSRGA